MKHDISAHAKELAAFYAEFNEITLFKNSLLGCCSDMETSCTLAELKSEMTPQNHGMSKKMMMDTHRKFVQMPG